MRSPLETSVASQRASLAAAMLVRTPHALRVLARVLAVGVGLTALGLAVIPWQQSVTGEGRVVAFAPLERQQELNSPIEGRVTRWHVSEGSRVKQGDLLLELTDNDPSILTRLGEERAAIIARREATITRGNSLLSRQKALDSSRQAGIRAAENRVAMARERIKAARQALEGAQAAQLTGKLNLERQLKLVEQGLASQRNLELAQLEAVRSATDTERAQAALQAAIGEEIALDADRYRVEHDLTAAIDDARAAEASALSDEANAAAELARLEVRLSRQSTMEVRAPVEGTVLRLQAGQGSAFVKAGERLVTLIPDTKDRAVELWVDGNDMPLLSEGRPVRLQFEGWPAVQFTGWPSVAVGTFGGKVALIDATNDGRGSFRIVIKPDEGSPWPSGLYLRQGVRVNGWVLLEQVTLGYELWRRFNGFPPRILMADPDAAEKGKSK